ncbi:MAG TPA: hypothetical protein DCY88_07900 [Cyanobacteria bacterium UBA11372]|nr:hypothetical protein [Cyanobacteria bacterium UBA11372]
MQLELFNTDNNVGTTWLSDDDWETPNSLAKFVAELVSDCKTILAPGAGRGQIEKYLSPQAEIYAIENNYKRFIEGRKNVANAHWQHADFFQVNPLQVQAVVCNPPFSQGCEFIEQSLNWLDTSFPKARCVFILPIDFFCAKERGRFISGLNCHFYQQYPIVGRIAFLRDGAPENRPQRYHAVFDIRPGQSDDSAYNLTWI